MNPLIQFLLEDEPWSEAWEPTPEMLEWFRLHLSLLRTGAVWALPGTGQVYLIDHEKKTLTLVNGSPNDPYHWHDKNKKACEMLGYRVLDGPDDPNQMSFAESIVAELMEDDGSPFTKTQVTLQYRPFQNGKDWTWFWVLLPEDGSKALATGEAPNRAAAATTARQEARKLNVVVGKIDVVKPHTA